MRADKKFRELVTEATSTAVLVAYDDCHKIYIAMDADEGRWYTDNKWTTFIGEPKDMTRQVIKWYESSCGLEYVDATSTGQNSTESDHYSDFHSVIPQGARPSNGWAGYE